MMAACWDGGPRSSARCGRSSNSAQGRADTLRRWQARISCPSCRTFWRGRPSRRRCRGRTAQMLERSAAAGVCVRIARCRRSSSCSRVRASEQCGPACCSSTGSRGRSARARLGHHIAALLASPAKAQLSARRHGGPCARSGSRRCARQRRIPPDERAEAHRRGRGSGRRRLKPRTASSSGPALRRLLLNPLNRPFSTFSTRRSSPPKSADRANGFQYNLLARLFALHLNLREPPKYAAMRQTPRARACA